MPSLDLVLVLSQLLKEMVTVRGQKLLQRLLVLVLLRMSRMLHDHLPRRRVVHGAGRDHGSLQLLVLLLLRGRHIVVGGGEEWALLVVPVGE